jgi:hypothetical protein
MDIQLGGFSFKYFCVYCFISQVANLTGLIGMTNEVDVRGTDKNEPFQSVPLNNSHCRERPNKMRSITVMHFIFPPSDDRHVYTD